MVHARFKVFSLLLACAAAACGDRCLTFDYAPPSARFSIVDSASGDAICSADDFFVDTSRGPAIPHEDTCEWWVPDWAVVPDAGIGADVSELTVSVGGYEPVSVPIPIVRNACAEVQQPPLQEIRVEPE